MSDYNRSHVRTVQNRVLLFDIADCHKYSYQGGHKSLNNTSNEPCSGIFGDGIICVRGPCLWKFTAWLYRGVNTLATRQRRIVCGGPSAVSALWQRWKD